MSIVQDSIEAEVQEKIQLSHHYNNEIQTAKTATKMKYFRRKLRRNNEELGELLITLEKLHRGNNE